MAMITPADVIRRIELYYEGGALAYATHVAKFLRDSKPVSETHQFSCSESGHADAYNAWKTKTVETLLDGNQNIV